MVAFEATIAGTGRPCDIFCSSKHWHITFALNHLLSRLEHREADIKAGAALLEWAPQRNRRNRNRAAALHCDVNRASRAVASWSIAAARWKVERVAVDRAAGQYEHTLRRSCFSALRRYHIRKQHKAALLKEAYGMHTARLQT